MTLDSSFGVIPELHYFLQVEEENKLDSLVRLIHSLKPSAIKVTFNNTDKLDSFKEKLINVIGIPIPGEDSTYTSGPFTTYTSQPKTHTSGSKCLVVVFDYVVPKNAYYTDNGFHVLFVTAREQELLGGETTELDALGFIYINGVKLYFSVKFPLNKEEKT